MLKSFHWVLVTTFFGFCFTTFDSKLSTYELDKLKYDFNSSASIFIPRHFEYSGLFQTFVVPNDVKYVIIEAFGAQGGNWLLGEVRGGNGAYVAANVTVIPGQILYVHVGDVGCSKHTNNKYDNTFKRIGICMNSGGMASDVRTKLDDLSSRLIVAGGGGGSGLGGVGKDAQHISRSNNEKNTYTLRQRNSLNTNKFINDITDIGSYGMLFGGGGGEGYIGGKGSIFQGGSGGISYTSGFVLDSKSGVRQGNGLITIWYPSFSLELTTTSTNPQYFKNQPTQFVNKMSRSLQFGATRPPSRIPTLFPTSKKPTFNPSRLPTTAKPSLTPTFKPSWCVFLHAYFFSIYFFAYHSLLYTFDILYCHVSFLKNC